MDKTSLKEMDVGGYLTQPGADNKRRCEMLIAPRRQLTEAILS
jgi:hypothetical protein